MMDTDDIITAIEDRFKKEGFTQILVEKRPVEHDGDFDDVFWVGIDDITRIVDGKEVHPGCVVRVDANERLRDLSRVDLLWHMRIDDAARALKEMVRRSTQ